MDFPVLIQNDKWLTPYARVILDRQSAAKAKKEELTKGKSLTDFATGYLWFGLHRTHEGWVLREWAPNASSLFLTGTFNDWKVEGRFEFKKLDHGNWELSLQEEALHHGDLYALIMFWPGGSGKRIPAWAWRTVQDERTYNTSGSTEIMNHC
jgi:1,4-alpha-glucan branching enzyme